MITLTYNTKYLSDWIYYDDDIYAGGMITENAEKNLIMLDGVLYNKSGQIGSFMYDSENDNFYSIQGEDKEFVKEFAYNVLEEIKKERP